MEPMKADKLSEDPLHPQKSAVYFHGYWCRPYLLSDVISFHFTRKVQM